MAEWTEGINRGPIGRDRPPYMLRLWPGLDLSGDDVGLDLLQFGFDLR